MATTTDKKLKLLLFGCVGDKILPFTNKINALHKSKAGPFHLCFCVGSFHVPLEGTPEYKALQALPIPVFLQDALAKDMDDASEEIQILIAPHLSAFPSTKSNVFNVSIPSHPHATLVVASCPRSLRMDSEKLEDASIKPLMDKIAHVSYVGCDFLLTSHWPQGIEGLGKDDPTVVQQTRLSATYDVAEVALRARARYHLVPSHPKVNHYWQSPPFFHLASTTSTQTPQHTGRVVALGGVSVEKKVPKQNKFVHALGLVPLHAMDVQELQQSLGQGVAPCPFTDASYNKDNNASSNGGPGGQGIPTQTNAGFSEAQARRLLAESSSGGPQRWNLPNKNNRKRNKDQDDSGPQEVDPTNSTLFIHGLHKDVSGQLQSASNITLLQAFQPFGVQKVRRPPNAATTSFAFLEFDTHQQAKDCLETLGGETTVAGVHLTLKWGTHNSNNNNKQNGQHQHKRPRLTEDEAKDSSALYFRLPGRLMPSMATSSGGDGDDKDDKSNSDAKEKENNAKLEAASEHVRKWMEDTLENALSEEGNRITAAEEPALQVQVRYQEGQVYGFLDFASHAAASMAMATLTGNTNGGIVQCPEGEKDDSANDNVDNKASAEDETTEGTIEASKGEEGKEEANNDATATDEKKEATDESSEKMDAVAESARKEDAEKESKSDDGDKEEAKTEPVPSSKLVKVWGLALHWAHAKQEKSEKSNAMIQDANCDFTFQRQHFPADARQDCWFCLASEGCEKHLISGVFQQCYAAMPKGAMHKGHVLLIPVTHSSQGAFVDKTNSREIGDLQKALRRHAQEEYDMDLFCFERAIQTRGGYHTHLQCVPVPKGLGVKLETTLRAQAKANKIDLREIQSPDLVVSTLLSQNEDAEGGYFYAEVPVTGRNLEFKRFLYQVKPEEQQEGNRRGPMVPIQFGREVIAAVLGKKELAHWKSCQVDKEEETKMAADLRKSFEKYYDVDN